MTERLTTSTVPGRVEAERYADGGEGIAYHVAHGDWGTAAPRSDSMDIAADATASGGYAVGWIDPGQWFAYDVDVATAAAYTLSPRVTAPWQPGALHVALDGVDVTGEFNFGVSSSWINLPQSPPFTLSGGAHRLEVLMDGHAFNFDSMDLNVEPVENSPWLPGRVEAESYAAGGEGIAYHVAHGDWGTAQPRSDSMDIAADTTASGDYAIGWIDPGQWFAYDVNVAAAGTYTVSPRVSAPWQPGALHVDLDGVDVTGELNFGISSGWVTPAQSPPFTLSAGAHRLEVLMDGHGYNLDSLDVKLKQVANSPWVPAGYDLVFDDEFDEGALDTSKWWTRYVYANGTQDFVNDEVQRYRESNNHVMTGSTLKLTLYKNNPDPAAPYTSGMIRAKTLVRYGYAETRVKMPKGIGAWPAFWLSSEPGNGDPNALSWPPEIDIFEFADNGTDDRPNMLNTSVKDPNHKQDVEFLYTDPNFNIQYTHWTAPFNFTDDFHVIGLLWDASDQVTTYVDGTRMMTVTYHWTHDDGSDAQFADILLNYAIGGQWAGRYGIDDSVLPQALEVDYVRVYQKTHDHRLARSTIGVDLCPTGGGC